MLNAGPIKASLDGNTLLAKHPLYTTSVAVVPAAPVRATDGPIMAVVQVKTELPADVRDMMKQREWESAAAYNPMAALGALTVDSGGIYVGSRLTIYEDENAWQQLHLPLLLFSIVCGTEAILGAIQHTFGTLASRGGHSAWTAEDFDLLERMLSRFCDCSSGGLGFTAEFEVKPRASLSGVGHPRTALLHMRADQPHPALGGGLFILLQLPHRISGEEEAHRVCARLNLLEMEAGDLPPHFGAWCLGRMGTNLAYVSFLPNQLHAVPNIAMNAAMWGLHRTEWAGKQLAAMGY